ncbi:hypothetical protein FH972_003644 [Carpinus fangiana]|uniref:Prephenate dehydratase domain-containing protein n=1 Tax=Carpinus fangiana TaxID=176857 RepID=A0A5N6QIU1_9ROSI|nr:hypothetical protein FH972_003644 [Carpinus fangiana]
MHALSPTISGPGRISYFGNFFGLGGQIIFEPLTPAPICVAYVGVAGAYSHSATLAYYPKCLTLPTENTHQLLQMVEQSNADVAILPVWCSGET